MTNVHKQVVTKKPEYKCDTCEFKSTNEHLMKDHVKLHRKSIKCKTCSFECKEEDTFIEHAIKCHSMQPRQEQQQQGSAAKSTVAEIECFSCGTKVSSRRDLTEHRKEQHYKQKLCRFYHSYGYGCRFPDTVCVDIHGSTPQQTVTSQPQAQQRQSVIQPNSQYRSRIPCRDGDSCGWVNSTEGCRYYHTEGRALIQLVQAGLNLRENVPSVPQTNSMTDFPGLGYSKNKLV